MLNPTVRWGLEGFQLRCSHLVGRVRGCLVLVFLMGLGWGCAPSATVQEAERGDGQNRGEYSLKSDRSHLANMREHVPHDIQLRNDEWALVLQHMAEGQEHPSQVREKFADISRQLRQRFSRDRRQEREGFNQKIKLLRQAFTTRQTTARKEFQLTTPNRQLTAQFYEKQNRETQEFYLSLRTQQNEFEADQRQKQRDFDAYLAEKQRYFEQEYRDYNRRYTQKFGESSGTGATMGGLEAPASGRGREGSSSLQPSVEDHEALREFQKFPKGPGVPL